MTQTLYQRRPDLVAANMDGERVMLDVQSGRYFSLRGVGAFIWDAIETPKSQQAIIDEISETFDTSNAGNVPGDVAKFLDQLQENGMVQCVPA